MKWTNIVHCSQVDYNYYEKVTGIDLFQYNLHQESKTKAPLDYNIVVILYKY